MSKNNQTELEAMTAERDHWRKLATERQETIEDQQRHIERMSMLEGAFGAAAGGFHSETHKIIEQLQIERDQAYQERDHLLSLISNELELAHRIATLQKDASEKSLRELEKLRDTDQPNILTLVLLDIARKYAQESVMLNELQQTITQKNTPEFYINKTRELWNVAFCWEITQKLALAGISYLDRKKFHALEIITLCQNVKLEDREDFENFEEPLIKALQRLGLDWVKSNLPRPPEKLPTLCKGLIWAQRKINSGDTIIRFTDFHQEKGSEEGKVTEKRLRTYLDWYEKIADFGKPPKSSEKVPTEIDQTF